MLEEIVDIIDCMQQSDTLKIKYAEEYVEQVNIANLIICYMH